MLEFNVKNQTISRVDRFDPATDSVDYLTAKFNFITADWDGKMKKALFRSGTVSYEAAINSSGVCTVPWEVLVSPDNKFSALSGCIKIFVSVVGTSGTIQIPTKECRIELGVSGLTESLNGAEPTPNLYEQFVDTIKADNDATVAEIEADNDETVVEVEALKTSAETAATSAEQSAASMKNDYCNALKGTASGEVVRVDDVSPVEHTAKVKISGDVDPSTVTVTRCGKNLIPYPYASTKTTSLGVTYEAQEDGGIKANGTPTGASGITIYDGAILWCGECIFSISGTFTNATCQISLHNAEGLSIKTWQNSNEFKINTENYPSAKTMRLVVKRLEDNVAMSGVIYPQLETGHKVTDYEQYNGTTYTPNADGTCDIVSVSPTMTLLTDTEGVTVDLEYNRDINKVIADLYNKLG